MTSFLRSLGLFFLDGLPSTSARIRRYARVALIGSAALLFLAQSPLMRGHDNAHTLSGSVTPGDGTFPDFGPQPTNNVVSFFSTLACVGSSGSREGFIQQNGTYSIIALDDSCTGHVVANPPGYLTERVDNVVTQGNTVLNITIYSEKAWLSGFARDAVTGAALPGSVLAFDSGGVQRGSASIQPDGSYSFGGTPGHPRLTGGLPVTRPLGVLSGAGSETYTLTLSPTGYPAYKSPAIRFRSGDIKTYNISLFATADAESVEDVDKGPCDGKSGCEVNAGHPVNLTNGNAWVQHRDYVLPGLGGGLELVRTWNSLGHNIVTEPSGMFGDRWRSSYEERLTTPTNRPTLRKYWRADGSAWLFKENPTLGTFTLIAPPDERAWLAFDSGTNLYTLTFLDGTKRTFRNVTINGNVVARLETLTDRNGNTTTVAYDPANPGRITQVTDAAGRSITFTYGLGNQLATSVQDATGAIANYTYNLTKLERVDHVGDASVLDYVYDASSRVFEVRDAGNVLVEKFTYDTSSRATISELANSVDKITINYAPTAQECPPSGASCTKLTRKANSGLDVSTFYRYGEISARRFIYKITGPGCSSCGGGSSDQDFSYDAQGNRVTSTDANGNTTTYTYDSMGNVLSRSIQVGGATLTWSWTYNSFGQVLTATDPLLKTTTNVYDAKGNLLSTTTPSPDGVAPGSTTSFAYDLKGQLTRVTDPRGNATTFAYTTAGLLASVTDALNSVTTFEYDARGNRTAVVDALNNRTAFAYDARNRLTLITYPDLSTTSFAYDSRGRRTSVTDANSKATQYFYDDADRLIRVKDAALKETLYGYDTESNLTSITDAMTAGRVTSFDYYDDNRLKQVNFPSTLTEAYTYDAVGNLLTKRDRKNQTISYTYDALNRLTRKEYPDTTGVDYTYDALSRLTQAVDATGTYKFFYDNLGHLTEARANYTFPPDGTVFIVSYTYDAASNRVSMTDAAGGLNTYVSDQLNRLTGLTNFRAESFGFGYDALSRRIQLTRPNKDIPSTYQYDSLSRLLSVLHGRVSFFTPPFDGATYTVDPVANRTSKLNHLTDVTENYTYDAIYQLTQVTQGGPATESYTYDPVGNRLSSLGVSPYVYNSSNQLTSKPGVTYIYDNNGNLTSQTPAGAPPHHLRLGFRESPQERHPARRHRRQFQIRPLWPSHPQEAFYRGHHRLRLRWRQPHRGGERQQRQRHSPLHPRAGD